MPRVFLIDTDTASDDAVALIMALRPPGVHVAAITVVAGNVPLAQATRNALYTAEICDSPVPIYPGADRPLIRPSQHAQWFHGNDGLGDQGYPPPVRHPESRPAVDAIIETVTANPGLTVVTLGPLTNMAQAFTRTPEIAASIGRLVLMGGNPCTEGNVTPAAEYNIWCDPEAARIVIRSGAPIELIGWQLCRGEANLRPADIDQVLSFNTPLARFAIECNATAMKANHAQSGEIGISLPDPIAMAVALDPAVSVHSTRHYVDVETTSDLTRGMTVVDRLNVATDPRNRTVWSALLPAVPNCSVCWEIDVPLWKQILYAALR